MPDGNGCGIAPGESAVGRGDGVVLGEVFA